MTPTPTPPTQGQPLAIDDEALETAAEVTSLGRKIRDWQLKQRNLSDQKLVERFMALGSTKTYKRILDNDLGELNLDKQLSAYRAVWESICEELPQHEDEEIIENLDTIVKPRLAAMEARNAAGNTRFVLIEGDTGCGKTTGLKALQAKYKGIFIEASAAWKDRPSALLYELALALGEGKDATLSQPRRLREVISAMGSKQLMICIDEGHEMGPKCLNTLRTLINGSRCVFVVAALHTLWERLEKKDAYAEARQLIGNRLQRRVKLHRVSTVDARRLIQHLTGIEGDPQDKDGNTLLAAAAQAILAQAPKHGNMKFVRRVANTAKELAEHNPVTGSHIAAAITAELEKR